MVRNNRKRSAQASEDVEGPATKQQKQERLETFGWPIVSQTATLPFWASQNSNEVLEESQQDRPSVVDSFGNWAAAKQEASLQRWGEAQVGRSCGSVHCDADADTEDTATSSSSETTTSSGAAGEEAGNCSSKQQLELPLGEDESITSTQPPQRTSSAAFSFGCQPVDTPVLELAWAAVTEVAAQ